MHRLAETSRLSSTMTRLVHAILILTLNEENDGSDISRTTDSIEAVAAAAAYAFSCVLLFS